MMGTNVQTGIGCIKLGDFLKKNEQEFLDLWEEQTIVHNNEYNRVQIRENGSLMYQIIINAITNNFSEEDLKSLANKVAQERVDANNNIGEFVYNVNLGRSIIIKCVTHSGILLEEIQPIIDLINNKFDLFCFYAVSKYTDLKDQKLQEKNVYITQTHKDRLAILGQMSSSFVHEFRNPLTSVMGFIKLLKSDYPDLPYVNVISSELEQLKFKISQFLHTSKLNTVVENRDEDITIKLLIEEVIDFLYASIVDGNIHVTSTIDENIKIHGDRNELKQVFLNLLMNAIDAVCEEDINRFINIHSEVKDDHITIMISNNGPKISSDAAQFIFEPFYTTKKLGTGIGLFVCKNILEKNHGKIIYKSDDDLTIFQITLPII